MAGSEYIQQFSVVKSIDKGWSSDRKYYVEDMDANPYLLRVSSIERLIHRQTVYKYMKQLQALQIPMNQAISIDYDEENIYFLLSWIEGRDLGEILPLLKKEEQYRLGFEAGRILKQIHTLEAPAELPSWENRYQEKIDRKLKKYLAGEMRYAEDSVFLEGIQRDRFLLHERPSVYHHGDYHEGNMMVQTDGGLTIIDFDRSDFGDPWAEFDRIPWTVARSPIFASAMIHSYFDYQVPSEFWTLLRLYIYTDTLSSLPWAIPFGQKQIQVMLEKATTIAAWYDSIDDYSPSWYIAPKK